MDGLCALAVIAVVGYHTRVPGFAGGYVGVDALLVVFGFLVTRLLWQELASRGSISVAPFWARRARRLVPTATLVAAATVVAGRTIDSPLERSPQHFSPLTVAALFCVLAPVTMIWLTHRTREFRRLLLVVTVAGSAAVMLAAWWLGAHRAAWTAELLAGAAVGVAASSAASESEWWRATATWIGLGGIGLSVVTFDATVPYPGAAVLLPVGWSILLLVAAPRVLTHPVLQWIGRHAYSVYLWHWPALVLAEARFGPLLLPGRLLVVAMAVWLAVLTVRHVEGQQVRPGYWGTGVT